MPSNSIAAMALGGLLHPNSTRNDFSSPPPLRPALYATPDPAAISSSSPPASPSSSSPYLLNHKRRRPPPPPPPPTHHTIHHEDAAADDDDGGAAGGKQVEGSDGALVLTSLLCDEEGRDTPRREREQDEDGDKEEEDFFDPRESLSVASSSDVEDGGTSNLRTPLLFHTDFYDTADDFFSDGSVAQSTPSSRTFLENELRTSRVSLLEEIEKRKNVEKAHAQLHSQWQSIADCLSLVVGLSFPKIQYDGVVQHEIHTESFCQEILVARLVSEAIEKGIARAEAEEAAQAVIASKNHEISRLEDRLQYYEALNHEMSHRNQEIAGRARHKRIRRRIRQKWMWSFVSLSITVGASLLAYSYLPHSAGKDLLVTSCPDAATPSGPTEAGEQLGYY